MFCPKCGLQNADNTKFCRSCGADLSNVLAVVEGKLYANERLTESHDSIHIYSSGIRNLLLGIGFFIIAILLFTLPGNTFYWLLIMFPAFSLIASGVSRIVKANGIKIMEIADVIQPNSFPSTGSNPTLPPLQTGYIKPSKSTYGTDDLLGQPLSVTESTTRRLQIDSEGER
jgi:hypothetical protein